MTQLSIKPRRAPTEEMTAVALRRIVLVGEDNPLSSAPEHALYPHPPGCAGNRLMKLLGLPVQQYLAINRMNLCTRSWDGKEAKRRAQLVLADPSAPWRVVVMLGSKVKRAFGIDCNFFYYTTEPSTVEWMHGPVTLVSLPHPSGRNRVWNDPTRKTDVVDVMRAVAPDVPWGELDHG